MSQQNHIDALLTELIEKKGSDLHVKAGSSPYIRSKKDLSVASHKVVLSNDYLVQWLKFVRHNKLGFFHENAVDWLLQGKKDIDFTYQFGKVRFRTHVYSTSGGNISIAFRRINTDIPSIEELKLPSHYGQLADMPQGLILVTGATGSGKTTTIATLIETINKRHKKHIVTLEDPIEFVFENKMSLVDQREVGKDIPSFDEGTLGLFREDPDVILLGEIRGKPEMESALKLASSGHVVFATLHTSGVINTLGRILSMYEAAEVAKVKNSLSDNLKCIINQALFKTKEDKVVALLEHLFVDSNTRRVFGDKMVDHQLRQILESESNRSRENVNFRWQTVLTLHNNGILDLEEATDLVNLYDAEALPKFNAQRKR